MRRCVGGAAGAQCRQRCILRCGRWMIATVMQLLACNRHCEPKRSRWCSCDPKSSNLKQNQICRTLGQQYPDPEFHCCYHSTSALLLLLQNPRTTACKPSNELWRRLRDAIHRTCTCCGCSSASSFTSMSRRSNISPKTSFSITAPAEQLRTTARKAAAENVQQQKQ